ncbi:MAG: VCBS repeat-containing protein [Phycisphaerae bacterium]|nr:VCBS repeat-containing protein [Phycisphaerae bacterium]MCZ2399187.1 VCBS repeat-containing protein [Phycisphaerae bacterium]NUQ49751.1 VCBS repeat-containing protein [Phycisphaerae bacterium]
MRSYAHPLWITVVVLAAGPVSTQAHDDEPVQWSRYFGFSEFEVYRLKRDIGLLRLADLDGDGRTDVLLWNGDRNRIELFYQRGDQDQPAAAADLDRNEPPDRGKLRSEHLPVTYRVSCLDVGEFTGDGRPDIVFFGEPREVVILPGQGGGGFGPPMSLRVPEGNPRAGSLAVGDFNHDGHDDVALLGENALLVLLQRPEGGFGKPMRLVHNVPQTLLMLPGDFNGDGRTDLIIGVDDPEYGALVFIQDESGSLGAMRRIRVPQLRSITIAHNRSGGDDVFSVEGATGRLRQFRWDTPRRAMAYGDWPQWLYSLPIEIKSKRLPVVVGDITGDGRTDVIAAAPDSAQIVLFEGGPGGLRPGVAFPALQKISDLVIADVDGDGKPELLTVSPDEKMIGISHYEDGRLTFPQAEASVGNAKPMVATHGPLTFGGRDERLAYLCRTEPAPGSAGKAAIELRLTPRSGETTVIEFEKLPDEPEALRLLDVNQDGRNDLVLFVRFAPLMVWLQNEAGGFDRFEGPGTRSELVKEAVAAGSEFFDVNGDGKPELILAQKNMARALAIQNGRWTVIDQYNPESADAEITGLTILPPDVSATATNPRLALYDRRAQELLVLSPGADGTYRVAGRVPVGAYDVQAMTAGPLAANDGLALLLADAKKLALFTPDRAAASLVDVQTYETRIKDAFPADAAVGDLNGDGRRDVVLVDTRRANLELLTAAEGELQYVLHFQVFQGKRFSGQPDFGGEPREVLVGDVDGNGRDDIVLIVHDRLIVYPSQ